MNNDREKRYNREFLKWKQENFFIKNDEYKPLFHVNPSRGLLNDPNCTFFKNGYFYLIFQHHPLNTIHGLKTMSLAKTKDFVNFEYKYMINNLDSEFESHGSYTGNAILYKDKIITLYTGNKRDKNWIRTSSVIYSEFDLKNEKIINKRKVLDNHDYPQYTEHFRDPNIFKYKNEIYFLLGAQRNDEKGVILLFKFTNKELTQAKLIKEIFINDNYRMIECPNIAFIKGKAVLIFSPQYTLNKIDKKINPDIVRYLILNTKKLFNKNKILDLSKSVDKEKILDYGLEFYAPLTFLKSKNWYVVGWSGIPTSNDYPETKYGWIFMLSMVKKMNIVNNELILEEIKDIKYNYINSENKKVFYQKFYLKNSEQITIKDNDKNKLMITFKNNKIIIVRENDKKYYPYDSSKEIPLNSKSKINNVEIEIYFDVSIIEIKIDKKNWYTSRLYINENFLIEKK